uniref:hypothetical protein n=1 Tax=Microseira wollei TaxID=467598 RepID=UPI0035A24008
MGEDVTNWQVGTPVVVMHHIACMGCAYCMNDSGFCCQWRRLCRICQSTGSPQCKMGG